MIPALGLVMSLQSKPGIMLAARLSQLSLVRNV